MSSSENEKKAKKADTAFAIYAKHAHKRDTMKKREFRALVVEEIAKTLGVTNKGTLGYYYSWADQVNNARKPKVYSRGDGSRARKGSKKDERTEAELTKLSNQFAAAASKRASKKEGGNFGAGGFGAPTL